MCDNDVHDYIDEAASAVAGQVIAWRQHLHQNPELSNREVNTAALISAHLNSLGFDEVRTGIAGHGVVGVLKGGRQGARVIALRADIDALPVTDECGASFASKVVDETYPGGPFPVSHACGHDCHTAMLLGAATVLSEVRESRRGQRYSFFNQLRRVRPSMSRAGPNR
jgi:metal-dependent amidase/aminoacylase/carboxypeptidase family protein